MERVQVTVPEKTYEVLVESGLRHRLKEFIDDSISKVLIIADDHVADLYLDDCMAALSGRKSIYSTVVPAGEATKSFHYYEKLLDSCVQNKLDRHSLIIALGGGMAGDLAGFVAATYLRGVAFLQMPTSILAHDSSVGGKVAINHAEGKNLIGAFHHPERVLYDLDTLSSLPEKEKRSGYGEIVKHALLSDKQWFLEVMDRAVSNLSPEEVKLDLVRGIKLKAGIVGADEKEKGERKHLNLGHTLAHAMESELNYGSLTHGEAVVIGTLFALRLSGCEEAYTKLLSWARANEYPLAVLDRLDEERVVGRMKVDKKARGDRINYVLLKDFGEPYVTEVEEHELIDSLKQFRSEVMK